MRNLLVPGALYYLLASTVFLVAFGLIPFSLYLHSGEDWELAPTLVLKLAAIGLLAFGLIAGLLRLLAIPLPGAAASIAIALFCLGGFLLLAHVYAPVPIGPLDGSEGESAEPLVYTLVEIGLLLAAIAAFWLLRRGRGLPVAGLFAGSLWLIGAGYLVAMFWPGGGPPAEAALPVAAGPAPAECPDEGNVYHIVLDTLQTDALLDVLDREGWHQEFAGFEIFDNNIANYLVTANSRASYFTGMFYHQGDLREWRRAYWQGGIFETLAERDYRIWKYAPFRPWRNEHVDVFSSSDDVFEAEVGITEAQFYDFLSVWLTSLAPNPLTNEAARVAGPLAERLFAGLASSWRDPAGGGGAAEPVRVSSGFHAYAGSLLLREMVGHERRRADRCAYVYAHAMLPHHPFVLDGECRHVGRGGLRAVKVGEREAYLQQATCALRHVVNLIRELKDLGRYDAATIIVHGDTGNWIHFRSQRHPDPQAETLGKPDATLLAEIQALLMIKRPHAEGPPRVDHMPTQLVDLYPTLLDVLGLEIPGGLHGRSVYAAPQPREARFALDPDKSHGADLVEVRIDDPQSLDASPLTVLGPPDDPANWREEIRRAAGGPNGSSP